MPTDHTAILSQMSLPQKVGVLLMAPLVGDRLDELLGRFYCGSLLNWGKSGFGETRCATPEEMRALHNRAQDVSLKHRNMPVWLHGRPGEFAGMTEGVWLREAAETKTDPREVEARARTLGARWRELGMHNMPEPTVNVPLFETCIFRKLAISTDPEVVATYASAFVRGVSAARCGTMAQHFPAHGAAPTDSHNSYPVVDLPEGPLWANHMMPYQRCFDAGCTTICTAHLACPALDPDPQHMATTSKPILVDALRGRMHFTGIAIADAMEMKGFQKNGPIPAMAVDAVNAGCDSLCMVDVKNVEPVFTSLLHAAEQQRIPVSRLDEAALRHLKFMDWLGLFQDPFAS
ncbi:MAG: hypothetical protein A3K19_12395 [Lentisphaerae bacterium RIFOXYB12_FULL_65_16]|nr:MAG: hypothetical protein A3K18_11730 [Lentisphaerae bacterium RIFOXYA12_64_32]OGV84398.1 MAG: hypothetical protein A3K19_12395 [Lentisphaerae bacterium RIFOXYB12_FULL_65_16]